MKVKLICPNCGNIIEVEKPTKNEAVFCKECQQSYMYTDIKKATNQVLTSHLQKGQSYLYQQAKYKEAALEYKECLRVKDNDMAALTGYIVGSIYGSEVDTLDFGFITKEIEKRDIVLNNENTFMLLNMIKDLLVAFKMFVQTTGNLFVVDGTFTSERFFNIYLNQIIEGKKVLSYFKDAFKIMEPEEFNDFNETNKGFMEEFEGILKDYNFLLNKTYNVSRIGDVAVENGKTKELGTNKKDIQNKEIKDMSLIPLNEDFLKFQKRLIVVFVVLILGALGLLITYFITKNKAFLLGELCIAALFVLGLFVFKKIAKKH